MKWDKLLSHFQPYGVENLSMSHPKRHHTKISNSGQNVIINLYHSNKLTMLLVIMFDSLILTKALGTKIMKNNFWYVKEIINSGTDTFSTIIGLEFFSTVCINLS